MTKRFGPRYKYKYLMSAIVSRPSDSLETTPKQYACTTISFTQNEAEAKMIQYIESREGRKAEELYIRIDINEVDKIWL